MTGSWLGLKAHPRAAEDRVRCGDAPELLWYVRRKQEEHSGKGSTMDAEQGKRQQQVFTLKDQHALTPHFSFSLMKKYLFNAKTF